MPVIGTLAAIVSLTIIVFGLPAQIVKNWKRKSCEGLAPLLVCSVLVAYGMWALYGWTKPDYFLAYSQTPGCALTAVLVFQLWLYQKKK